MVYQRYWRDDVNDMGRQRRKQAEFLIYQSCPWHRDVEPLEARPKTESRRASIPNGVRRPAGILAAKQMNPAADTSALEGEIDQQVYALYGLMPEEIKIVEET